MNLNSYHRQAFVKSVMDDVPRIDYSEQYERLIKADMLEVAPKKLRAVLEDKELAPYVLSSGRSRQPEAQSVNGTYYNSYSVKMSGVAMFDGYVPSKKALEAEMKIMRAAIEQMINLDHVAENVTAVIAGCRTLKQAHERLPEFVKYLPAEAVKGTMLPAIANLAADLVKMGWPKGGVPA